MANGITVKEPFSSDMHAVYSAHLLQQDDKYTFRWHIDLH
jgi:hypothetical protein